MGEGYPNTYKGYLYHILKQCGTLIYHKYQLLLSNYFILYAKKFHVIFFQVLGAYCYVICLLNLDMLQSLQGIQEYSSNEIAIFGI